MNKKELPPLSERTNYDILSETADETELTAVIRIRSNGAKVLCHIPLLTTDEEEKLSAELAFALMQLFYSSQDISRAKQIEILPE